MEPLDPGLRRLIGEGLRAAAPGPDAEQRGLARLLAALPGPGGPDGDGGPIDPTPIVGGKASALVTGLKALLLVGGVSAGAVGIVVITGDRPPAAPTIAAPRGPIDAPPPPTVAVTPVEPAPPIVEPAPPVRRPRIGAPVRASDDALLAETAAVAGADAALARGEYARARELAAEIARTYPKGQLALERTAIDLAARCGLAQPGARAAALEFLRAHADAAVAAKVRARCLEE